MNGDLDYYITFDTAKFGRTEAQFVVDKAPKGNYIWMLGDPNDFNTTLLEQGQTEVLQPLIDSGDIEIILKQNAKNWDPNEALKIAEKRPDFWLTMTSRVLLLPMTALLVAPSRL